MMVRLLGFIFFSSLVCSLYAQDEIAQDDNAQEILFEDTSDQDPDMDALRKWIREKRMITTKETGGDLSISGDVRFNFADISEKKDGIRQRGHHAATSKPARPYQVAFNLLLDFRTERTWAAAKIGYKNEVGVQSGTSNKIKLSKAFFGGRLINGDSFTFDGELGRRSLGNVFDSRVQFASTYDGALLGFSKAFETLGDYYTNLGVFLINNRRDYYGVAAEMGFLNIGNTGALLKASYIDWKKYHRKTPDDFRFNFRVSQLLLGYQFKPEAWPKLIKFYAAGLFNDAAEKMSGVFTPRLPPVPTPEDIAEFNKLTEKLEKVKDNRYNWAWYAGFSIGQARKKGDWAIDTNYQWVQAQAVPDFDISGISRGNAQNIGMYIYDENHGAPILTNLCNATGNANYHGWIFNALYAFTNNVTLTQQFEISNTLNKCIGPNLSYKKFKMELLFTF